MKLILILRSLLMTFVVVPLLTIPLCIAAIILHGPLKKRKWAEVCFVLWGQLFCRAYGVRVVTRGEENFPPGGCMILFNHTSFFDIGALYAVFPFFRFGAKLELFKIPVFGPTMAAVGTLPIARSNREAAIRVLQEAVQRAKNGEKFALSPEGGRSTHDETKLLPFKAGPFLFAIEAQVPLVPIIIRGAQDVLPKGGILPGLQAWRSTITLDVLAPIPTAGHTVEERVVLQEKARAEMEAALARPKFA